MAGNGVKNTDDGALSVSDTPPPRSLLQKFDPTVNLAARHFANPMVCALGESRCRADFFQTAIDTGFNPTQGASHDLRNFGGRKPFVVMQ